MHTRGSTGGNRGEELHVVEREIRKKYRYSNLSYVFDVYIECEYRANLTQEVYKELSPGEFRFDYESWGRRLGFSKKQMERAIKELTTESIVIIQRVRGNKGTCSKYFLARFQENNKERNKANKKRIINVDNTSVSEDMGEQKEHNEENKKEHSSRYNNLDIISNNIYSAIDYENIWNLYPNKKGKAIAIKKIPMLLKKYSKEELLNCVTRYSNEVRGKDRQYILNGSTFFTSRYVDYLDVNYQEEKVNSNNDLEEELF